MKLLLIALFAASLGAAQPTGTTTIFSTATIDPSVYSGDEWKTVCNFSRQCVTVEADGSYKLDRLTVDQAVALLHKALQASLDSARYQQDQQKKDYEALITSYKFALSIREKQVKGLMDGLADIQKMLKDFLMKGTTKK